MTKPYSLFKKSNGYFYVQFLLSDGTRSQNKSTGTKSRVEAERIAMEWIVTGNIPSRINAVKTSSVNVDKLSFFNSLKTYDFTEDEIGKIIKILKERKFILAAVRPNTKESILVDEFLPLFWNFEKSPFVKEREVDGLPVSASYCATMFGRVNKYWLPKFTGRTLGSITSDEIKEILGDEKIQKLAAKTINGIADAITLPIKWAFEHDQTENVCFQKIHHKTVKSKERKVLTMDIANKIMSIGWENDAAKLANKVAMHTGMRAGEIQGLRVKDIQDDGIHVNHSWSRYVGIKSCKNGESREIPIPISKSLKEELLNYAKFNPWDNGPEAFIFFAQKPGMPMNEKGWGKYLRRALREIGYENPDEICFHSWRHFFCSRMLDKITDKRIVMALSGHKTTAMLDHYAKHLEDEKTLEVVRQTMREVFVNDPDESKLSGL